MTRRPGDKTPPPPGGRAAERLRMFEQARKQKGTIPEPATPRAKPAGTESRRAKKRPPIRGKPR